MKKPTQITQARARILRELLASGAEAVIYVPKRRVKQP